MFLKRNTYTLLVVTGVALGGLLLWETDSEAKTARPEAKAIGEAWFEPIVYGGRHALADEVFGEWGVVLGPPVIPVGNGPNGSVYRPMSVSFQVYTKTGVRCVRAYGLPLVGVVSDEPCVIGAFGPIDPSFLKGGEASKVAEKMISLIVRPVDGHVWGDVLETGHLTAKFEITN